MSYNTNHLSRTSWNRISETVRKRDKEKCQYCGQRAEDGEPDHILPLSKGGRDSFDNLVWSCQDCNREKQGKTLREWICHVRSVAFQQVHESCQPLYAFYKTSELPVARVSQVEECANWLIGILSNGESIPVVELEIKASTKGISAGTLKRAKGTVNRRALSGNGQCIKSIRKSTCWHWVAKPATTAVIGDADNV